jgi:hypothetical protein
MDTGMHVEMLKIKETVPRAAYFRDYVPLIFHSLTFGRPLLVGLISKVSCPFTKLKSFTFGENDKDTLDLMQNFES